MSSHLNTIHPIPVLKDNYVWTMIDHHRQALIVDPGEAAPVIDYLKQHNLQLVGIFITHHHWDHTNGLAELTQHYSVPIFGPAIENISYVTQPLAEGDEIKIPGFTLPFTTMTIPGHTRGHIAYYSPTILFCGDTLFSSGCGRIFEGSPEEMYASLQKIAALPDETKIYCAHEYTLANLHFAKTVEANNKLIDERIAIVNELRKNNLPSLPSLLREEKDTNPFLRCDSPEIIAAVEKHTGQRLTHEVEVFAALRKWKDNF